MKSLLFLLVFVTFAYADQRGQPPAPPHPLKRVQKPRAPNSGVKIDFLKVGRAIRDRFPRNEDKKKSTQESEEEKQARIRRLMDDAAKENVQYRSYTRGSS